MSSASCGACGQTRAKQRTHALMEAPMASAGHPANPVAWFEKLAIRRSTDTMATPHQRGYIGCFETLAQLNTQTQHFYYRRRNTVSEAGVNKLFTTSWPLQMFVQLVPPGPMSSLCVFQVASHLARPTRGNLSTFAGKQFKHASGRASMPRCQAWLTRAQPRQAAKFI